MAKSWVDGLKAEIEEAIASAFYDMPKHVCEPDERITGLLLRIEALEGQVSYLENALRLRPLRDWNGSRKSAQRLDKPHSSTQNISTSGISPK